MRELSQTKQAINQRRYRKRVRESVIYLPVPLYEDTVRIFLSRAGKLVDLKKRRAAGKALGEYLEELADAGEE